MEEAVPAPGPGAARLERWALWAIGIGVALRLAAPFFMDLSFDANSYVAMAHGWVQGKGLMMQWGDVLTAAPLPASPSHHFPPAYPLYLGAVFNAFGYGLVQAKWAAAAMSVLALGVVYATTKDVYGRTVGLAVAGLFALEPHFLWLGGMGFSENLLLVFFALTMWGIVRSLAREPYILLAGLAAAGAYVTRASMGVFFLVAGAGGLTWRLYHRGLRTFRSLPYLGAILLFGVVVLAWAWRNVSLFGWPNWETSPGSRGIPEYVLANKAGLAVAAVQRAPYMLAVVLPPLLAFLPECRKSLRRIKDEHTSALWLSVVLVWLLAVFFSAIYLHIGQGWELWRLDNWRYVVVGLLPLVWAVVREGDAQSRSFQRRWLALAGVFLVGCAAVFAFPAHYLPAEAGRSLDPYLEPGDDIEVVGQGKYAFYAYVSHPEQLNVYLHGSGPPGEMAEFVLATVPYEPSGYTLLAHAEERHPFGLQRDDHVRVYGRIDVVMARGIELEPLRPGF